MSTKRMMDEANRLIDKYVVSMEQLSIAFRVEVTALAWKYAAEIISDMPKAIAVGRLSWDGNEAKATMPSIEPPKPLEVHGSPKNGHSKNGYTQVIKGSGKVVINGPKPKDRAEAYTQELATKDGVWARRGSRRVQYACVGWKSVPNGARPVFYLMKNTKNGKTITVKFDSIVSDWTHHDR